MSDAVNHPDHYADSCSLECIEAMELAYGPEAVYDFCVCNSFKYLWRYKHKNGIQDLEKANRYYEMSKDFESLLNKSHNKTAVISRMIQKKMESYE